MISLRPARPEDLAAIHAINEANQPAVGTMGHDPAWYVEIADTVLVAERTGPAVGGGAPVVGFVIVLVEGVEAYDSPNYRWFDERLDSFLYVDRVAVDASAQGLGVGRMLYDAVIERARALGRTAVVAEINTAPRNDQSLGFHARMGFEVLEEVADPRYEGRMVAMVKLSLA